MHGEVVEAPGDGGPKMAGNEIHARLLLIIGVNFEEFFVKIAEPDAQLVAFLTGTLCHQMLVD